jgi:phosphoglycolate phosphatase-like HAD superfamily hydrolase
VLDQLRRGHQLDLSPEVQDRFYGVYLRHLSSELDNPHALTCSGIRDLIASLHADDGWSLGLLTGNIRAGARVKLEHFGLWQYFPFGAFADDSGDRNRLGPVALERARQHLGRPDLRHTDLVVIGDTPHDIACARAVGAHAVATATGGASYDELAAHTPDLIVRDFSDPTPFLEFIRGLK